MARNYTPAERALALIGALAERLELGGHLVQLALELQLLHQLAQ